MAARSAASEREGELSQRLNALVSGAHVRRCRARDRGLGPHIRLGKQARDDGGEDSDNILGDVMEALIGACFRERGFDGARGDRARGCGQTRVAGRAGHAKHPKSALQEWAAGNRRKMPAVPARRALRAPTTPPRFTVAVAIKGVGEAQASGSSKQEAETAAAAEFMERFG